MKRTASLPCLILCFATTSCTPAKDNPDPSSTPQTDNTDGEETATEFENNTDAAGPTDHGGSWTKGELIADCGECQGVGNSSDNLLCAIDLCLGESVVRDHNYLSPTGSSTDETRIAVEHFGDPLNDLTPLHGGSYALMATGPALAKIHSTQLGEGTGIDPFARDKARAIYDVMEWKIKLTAPADAHGIKVHYVFFSSEYDEFIGQIYNDKFYIVIDAPSTNDGKRTVINYTDCRNPSNYSDFTCDGSMDYCEPGQKYCYVAINTALSECCWYNGCPNGTTKTNIEATGYECAETKSQEMILGAPGGNGGKFGSSTGWLATEWPVEPGEEFELIFHIHDTSDGNYDSEVILDKVVFVGIPPREQRRFSRSTLINYSSI